MSKEENIYLSSIYRKISLLNKDYGLSVGKVMSILGKSLEVDVFYLTDKELIDELDKLIDRQKKNKKG